jgi:hypothetical protein
MLALALLLFFGAAVAIGSDAINDSSDNNTAISDEALQAQQKEEQAKIDKFFNLTVRYKKRSDRFVHLIAARHSKAAHRVIKKSNSAKYEQYRANKWRVNVVKLRKIYLEKLRVERVLLRRCRQAGFPRWYCPVLKNATKRAKVPQGWMTSSALAWVISHESGFNPRADNPTSTAYGLFQMLTETSSNPHVQTYNGLRYVKGRYGTPENAQAFWRQHSWY